MSNFQVFSANMQKATRYKCDAGFIMRIKPHARLTCRACWKRHLAKNMLVQSYYDGDRFFGKMCVQLGVPKK